MLKSLIIACLCVATLPAQGRKQAGAKAVLATLWPVADLTTVDLMRSFYHNHYELGLQLEEALRRAQLRRWISPPVRSPS